VSTERRLVRILIADDHAPTRADVRRALVADERFEICADTADAAGADETGTSSDKRCHFSLPPGWWSDLLCDEQR
jgi:hypothetical protein